MSDTPAREDEILGLADAVSELIGTLKVFEAEYAANHLLEPAKWPLHMRREEWGEQFEAWIESQPE